MRRTLALGLLAVLLLIAPAAGLQARGQKVVAAGTVLADNLTTLFVDVRIEGNVNASVFVIGGSLTLSGEVAQDVICLGTDIDIRGTAVIRNDLIVLGGRLRKAENAKVCGEFFHIKTHEDLKQIAQSLLPFLPASGDLSLFKIAKIIFWLIVSLVLLALMPAKIFQASSLVEAQPLKTALIGLVSLVLFLFLLLSLIILSFIYIGIPLLLALFAAYFAVLVFGRTVIFYLLGSKLAAALKIRSAQAATLSLLLGVLIYAVSKFLPYAGPLFLLLLDIFVAGAGIGFIFRKKLFS